MLKSILVATALLSGMAVAQAKIPQNIAFDGNCDGMHFDKLGGGMLSGYYIGCSDGPFSGFNGHIKGQGVSNAVVDPAYGFFAVVRADGTYGFYGTDGALLGYGTWTAGRPLAGAYDAPPAVRR